MGIHKTESTTLPKRKPNAKETKATREEPEPKLSSDEDSRMALLTKTIGANMRAERKRRRLTIEMIAGQLGTAPSYIGLLERGERCPSLALLVRICELLGCTLDELTSPAGGAKKESNSVRLSAPVNSELRKAQESVISLISTLSMKELLYIAECMRALPALRKKK